MTSSLSVFHRLLNPAIVCAQPPPPSCPAIRGVDGPDAHVEGKTLLDFLLAVIDVRRCRVMREATTSKNSVYYKNELFVCYV